MERKVRVRFAPSPTGPLHIGGVRTALYNYLFAKKHGGDFILRIEDTDQNRYVPGAEEYIIESLKWCGIEPNEGVGFGDGMHAPYRQSERMAIYRQYAEKLVTNGFAYYAFDSEEELDALRKKMEAEKSVFSYNSKTRKQLVNSLTLSAEETDRRIHAGDSFVIRLQIPENEEVVVNDLIRGEVRVHSSQLDDKVLFKSDGMPTYHLANVVDDFLMQITHVIRGEEWLPSAPLHVLLYRSLGWEKIMPQFAHLPLLLKPDGNGKLSKRDGDRLGFPVFPLNWTDPVTGELSSGYREKNYIPAAFVNMLVLLGWHPSGDKEIFTMEELIHDFSLERVSKSGAKFDPDKTKWFNQEYLRHEPVEKLVSLLKPMIIETYKIVEGDKRLSNEYLSKVVSLLLERVQFENEFAEKGSYLFIAPTEYDQDVVAKKWKSGLENFFTALSTEYGKMNSFTSADIDAKNKETSAANQLKPGEILQLLRVIVSGSGTGVDLLGMMELLGKEEVINRINTGVNKIMQSMTAKTN
ncbi:MAG: glutamate--tRNA ligase [Bacteroidia bacterium]|nr:glutamate--tRNA ligase [Bacteroidota bacterium]MBP6427256.1 glutamate--tRNA ligase [Bacteroidia bacterium]MBP6657910.1 glutamate--tRNA ligase [Bacteroidia bacterium]